jgi:hypothetical protein
MNIQPESKTLQQFDEKGLLQPEANRRTINVLPPDLTPEERSAYLTLSRVNEKIEQPIHRAKPSAPSARLKSSRKNKAKAKGKRKPRKASNRRDQPAKLTAHQARCSICFSECRDEIEEEFLHWHSPINTAYDFGISDRAIYRHAHAVGLFERRDRNLRYALGRMIDRVDRIPVLTPESIIHAVQAFARINDQGQWIEPPKHLIVSQGPRIDVPATAPDVLSGDAAPAPNSQLPPMSIETCVPDLATQTPGKILIHRTDGPPFFLEQSKLDTYRNSLR